MVHAKMESLAKRIWHATFIRFRDWRHDRKYQKYWGERFIRNGREHADKTFYIVRRREAYTGLFSDFMVYVFKTKQALDAGYIPIIDMQTTENIYLNEEEIGKVNAWEYYFKQPCGYSLSQIAYAKNVILGSGFTKECIPYTDTDYLLNVTGNFDQYQDLVKKYFRLSDEALHRVHSFYGQKLAGEKIVGVLCRGTDYTDKKPFGHPKQPDVESVFAKVDEVLMRFQCTKIFLGTEDVEIFRKFKMRYQDRVVTNREHFVAYHGEQSIGKLIRNSVADQKEEGMVYLTTIALLSRCDCFVGGCTSGTVGVLLLNDQFEYKYLFDLGLYT